MSVDSLGRLERLYDRFQERFHIIKGSPALAEAVHFGTNRTRPVHRWFHFKEGFSADLLSATGVDTSVLHNEEAVFLDPFCGCGTTVLAGDIEHQWHAHRIGVEINPFLKFVAETKVSWRKYDPVRLRRLAEKVLSEPLREDLDPITWPALSTFHNEQMFAPQRISALIDLTSRVSEIDEPERDLLLLGVASAAEYVGFYRKDGRALRILRSPGELRERNSLSVSAILRRTWSVYEADLLSLRPRRNSAPGRCTVLEGDGRALQDLDDLGGSDRLSLTAYSPPYLNHIDYTEVYKVELWLLRFITNQQEMLDLRRQTLRSHASVAISSVNPDLPRDLAQPLELATSLVTATGMTTARKWQRQFGDLALAYLTDLQQALKRQYELLQPGGRVICVVANSAHGAKQQRIPVAVDLFIASLADALGFEVERLLVARQLRRRDHLNRFLRETALILRRPTTT